MSVRGSGPADAVVAEEVGAAEAEIPSGPRLASAFESFARASASLESAYGALRERVEDLSARLRRTEAELERSVKENLRLQEDAARRSRLEAMGRMAAEIAHEIRNPLGGLELTASLLRDDLRGDPRQELALSVLEGIRALTRVTGDLLSFTRTVQPRLESLDALACLRRTRSLVEPACVARGIALHLAAADEISFLGDPELFQQILLNLVQNALEATPAGGCVRLSAFPSAAGTVEFAVTDTGRGMDPETQSRVFDPFFTTREGGTGLGLPISFRLAEAQGARLELKSEPGVGSSVLLVYGAGQAHRERPVEEAIR